MTTRLSKKVSRISYCTIRECGCQREIVIEIEQPGIVYFRAKGCKRRYGLPASALYLHCLAAHVEVERKERAKDSRLRKLRRKK